MELALDKFGSVKIKICTAVQRGKIIRQEAHKPLLALHYDNLAEYYTDRQLPGVGISIGLTRLFYVLGEQGLLNPQLPTAPADVLILPMTDDLAPAISRATALRSAGIRTQLYTEQKKFKAKMTYANNLSIPYVVFLGKQFAKCAVGRPA